MFGNISGPPYLSPHLYLSLYIVLGCAEPVSRKVHQNLGMDGSEIIAAAVAESAEQQGGAISMNDADFGSAQEMRRDAARTFAAGSIFLHIVNDETPLRQLAVPTAGLHSPGGSVDVAAVDSHIMALAHALRTALPHKFSNDAFERLLPMLTVSPVLSALMHAGEAPTLQQRCCVLRVSTTELHCLNLGYVGLPQQAEGWGALFDFAKPTRMVLAVRSADLLTDGPSVYELTYAVRRGTRERLEEEALDESPNEHESLCTTSLVRREGRYVLKTIKDDKCTGCTVCKPHRVMDL